MNVLFKMWVAVAMLGCYMVNAHCQSSDDLFTASELHRKFPADRYAASQVIEVYRFDKGNGVDGQPVVTVEGNTTSTFVALSNLAYFQYYQFYNKFVTLKNFNYYYQNRKEQFKKAAIKPIDKAATNDGIFLDDNRVKLYDVRLYEFGAAAKFEFNEWHTDSKYFTRLFFNAAYPIKDHQIKLIVPPWMELEVKEINFDGYHIQTTKTTEGKNNVFTYSLQYAEPLKMEENAIAFAYKFPHIIVSVKKWTDGNQTNKGFQTVADLYAWYHYLYQKCNNNNETLKPLVAQLIAGKMTPEEKAKAIYYWVQDNIRYIAFEDGYAGFIPEAVQDVLKNKYSDCKGMANLTTEMLRIAGLDAHITWMGTKHIPYKHNEVHALCVDNHCISTLYINEKRYFLDGTEKYLPFGENAYRLQGKTALVEQGKMYELLTVPTADKAANKRLGVTTLSLNGNILKGHVKVTMSGEQRTRFQQYYQTLPTNQQADYFKSCLSFGNQEQEITTPSTSYLNNRDLPVVLEGEVALSNQVTKVGKEWFVSIDSYPTMLQNFNPKSDRQNDYDFGNAFILTDEVSLTIPANMRFMDIPESVQIETPDFAFKGDYSVIKNKMVFKKTLTITTGRIRKKDFATWSLFLGQVRNFNRNLISISYK